MRTADDNRKVTSEALEVTLVLHIFKLALYFNSGIISNQIKYYLATDRKNVLQIQYKFYRHTLQIHYQLLACYWKSMARIYQELKEVNVWNVTVGGIMVKDQ